MDRALKKAGIPYGRLSGLERLAWIGSGAMGALVFEPEYSHRETSQSLVAIERLAHAAAQFMEGNVEEVLSELSVAGGSPGGARPKVLMHLLKSTLLDADNSEFVPADCLTGIIGTQKISEGYLPFLIKFRGLGDTNDDLLIEFCYNKVARGAGLEVPDSYLIRSRGGDLYFASKRFDRTPNGGRLHFQSAAGLLHSNFRIPSFEYCDLLRMTQMLCKQRKEVEKFFRLACFNVIFSNRDDHGKNFGFCLSQERKWSFSPAYDLTFCQGPGGEHTTTICGEGKSPGLPHLKELAAKAGIQRARANAIIDEVLESRRALIDLLKEFDLSKKHPVYAALKL